MKNISLEEAKSLLDSCTRHECRDHAFGDREITWCTPDGKIQAEGYNDSAWIYTEPGSSETFYIPEEWGPELVQCGWLGEVTGLTLNGVLAELTKAED